MKNLRTVIIVESPTKIDSIKKYLDESFEVYASKGQIVELAKGGRYGIGVNPLKAFKAFYCLMPDKIGFLDQIISDVDNIDKIIIATDPDTEGHGIAWHISESLKHLHKPIFRAEFHEITKNGIHDGLKKTSLIDINKFRAQETRRILDRIVGFMVSPFLINFYGNNLSAGRVQSVATKLIVEREQEIKKFVPQEYWNMLVKLTTDNKQILIAKLQTKIKDQVGADKIKSDLQQPSTADSLFEVVGVIRKSKKETPPPPLNTSRMQQLMSSKYSVDGETTMAAAQILYENGLVTYIRTDSVRTSDTAIAMVRQWLTINKLDLPINPNVFKNKDAAQNAHECIRPTDIGNVPSNIQLSQEVSQLYELIWTHFVSSQMSPAIYDTLEIKIKHSLSGHLLKVSGKALISGGYLKILENRQDNNKGLEFPNVNEQQILKLIDDNSISLEQKFTQPPARYNYSTLIKELENRGIGRPSTYSMIASTIERRGYVAKTGASYHSTDLGDKINGLLAKHFAFMSYNYTSDLEQEMDQIAAGNKDYQTVLDNFYSRFKKDLGTLMQSTNGNICDKCGSPTYKRQSKALIDYWQCALHPFCRDFYTTNKITNFLTI